jgi:SAM-dependent methyltransferase
MVQLQMIMPFYDFFCEQEPTGLGRRWMKQSAEHLLDRICQVVHPIQKIVELGPGWGAFAQACRDRGIRYTAVDTNIRLLEELKPANTICSFVPPFPLHDRVCDVVVASHVLEHSNGLGQAQALVSEMIRIVREGGCVAIVSPDLLWVGKYFWDCDYSHSFPTSSRRLYHLFIDHRLEIVCLEYLHNHLTGWKGSLLGRIVGLIPYRIFGTQPTSREYSERVYRLRMTFARSVQIIGRRPKTASG